VFKGTTSASTAMQGIVGGSRTPGTVEGSYSLSGDGMPVSIVNNTIPAGSGIVDASEMGSLASASLPGALYAYLAGILGHYHYYYETTVVPPTCTEEGHTTYTCSCGDSYVGDYVAALGHDFSVLLDHKDAAADEDGYDIFGCSRCNERKTVVIPATGGSVTLVSMVTTTRDFVSIVETSKNSRVWVLTFNVTETYSNGETRVTTHSVSLGGNNANLDGRYKFGEDSRLAGYTLIYDIKGNGSNIKGLTLTK
ncbi:MAG: hypothetical protein FWE94_08180, partial [Coriobacteriia bacterium]|nr:hypothetical protein [Coriobacteriia bacterium]